jgi:AP endonuclease 1
MDRNSVVDFFCCPRRGVLGLTAFQHILQDPRTQNIPLIVATPEPGLKRNPKVVWCKEIGVLQSLTRISPAKSEEDLQSLVLEIAGAVEEATKSKRMRLSWIDTVIKNNPHHFRDGNIL